MTELGRRCSAGSAKRGITAGTPACRAAINRRYAIAVPRQAGARTALRVRSASPSSPAGQAPRAARAGAFADVIRQEPARRVTTTLGDLVARLDPDVAAWEWRRDFVALIRKGFYDGPRVQEWSAT